MIRKTFHDGLFGFEVARTFEDEPVLYFQVKLPFFLMYFDSHRGLQVFVGSRMPTAVAY